MPEAISRHALEQRARERGEQKAARARALHDPHAPKLEIEMPTTMEEIEQLAIEATLTFTGGDKSRAARALGIGRKTLYRKLQSYEQVKE